MPVIEFTSFATNKKHCVTFENRGNAGKTDATLRPAVREHLYRLMHEALRSMHNYCTIIELLSRHFL